jgi:hypothetical protein
MQSVKQQLQGRESLLAVDDGSLLHLPRLLLNLLQYDRTEEMWVVLLGWLIKDSVRYPHNVIPKWFPLALLVPHVRPLE